MYLGVENQNGVVESGLLALSLDRRKCPLNCRSCCRPASSDSSASRGMHRLISIRGLRWTGILVVGPEFERERGNLVFD